jgi:hypothetical protein
MARTIAATSPERLWYPGLELRGKELLSSQMFDSPVKFKYLINFLVIAPEIETDIT